jgi:hypothetical protein
MQLSNNLINTVWVSKSFLILIVVVNLTSIVKAQRNPALDTLKRYSYNLLGFKIQNNKPRIEGGSGFFFKKDGRTFFVTAKHVVAGCLDSARKNRTFPATMNIMILPSQRSTGDILSINTVDYYHGIKCETIGPEPDVIAIDVTDKNVSSVYSVEDFIAPPLKKVTDIQIFGFPATGLNKDSTLFNEPSGIHFSLPIDTVFKKPIQPPHNRLILINEDLGELSGYSGSPVFVMDKETKKIRLAGIFIGDSLPQNPVKYLIYVDADEIVNSVKNSLAKHYN